jgi:hypothetical protein
MLCPSLLLLTRWDMHSGAHILMRTRGYETQQCISVPAVGPVLLGLLLLLLLLPEQFLLSLYQLWGAEEWPELSVDVVERCAVHPHDQTF